MTDEQLAKKVQGGDAQAFASLVERYEQKMLRYTRKLIFNTSEVEDVVQEVFIKAYTNIQSFDTKRQFSPWLYRIAHNTIVNFIRKSSRSPVRYFDFESLASLFTRDKAPSAEAEFDKTQTQEMIEKCLQELPEKYRGPLVLYYIEELEYKEIADVLKMKPSTVGVRIHRAKQALHKIYTKTYGGLN